MVSVTSPTLPGSTPNVAVSRRTAASVSQAALGYAQRQAQDFLVLQGTPEFRVGQAALLVSSLCAQQNVSAAVAQTLLLVGAPKLVEAVTAEGGMARQVARVAIAGGLLLNDPVGAVLLGSGFVAGNELSRLVPQKYANAVRTVAALGAQVGGRALMLRPAADPAKAEVVRRQNRKLLQQPVSASQAAPVTSSTATAAAVSSSFAAAAAPASAQATASPAAPTPALSGSELPNGGVTALPATPVSGSVTASPSPSPVPTPSPVPSPSPTPVSSPTPVVKQPVATPVVATASPTPTAAPASHGLGTGLLIGIIAGVAAGVATCCGGLCYLCTREGDDD